MIFNPPMEDPSHKMPDIVLDYAAQSAIMHALEVAKHNQEFRDGKRSKPFSGEFVCKEIDNAISILAHLHHDAITPPAAPKPSAA
jgi:hypothetical protein